MASSAFQEFRAGLPPPAECLAILLGIAEVSIFGLAGLANPQEFAKGYGLHYPSKSDAQKQPGAIQSNESEQNKAQQAERTHDAYIAAIASRNIQNGVLLLTLGCYVRDRRALGIAVACCFITTLADALIVKAYGVPEMMWGHVTGIFNSITIGGSLLWWGRQDPWW
ncbi:hypothetical protein Tdes44962_MAKER06068 [Teratosphaeria destructans]|uniref:Uncharacterized protein n=1 Tax=Teratosphaeria destructans TaxID=418781 RepID=A0A9W7VY08_9PEZI|nr:hypothetical protein Tdes44962_MAKER06068 [Teratosphaeria destructans]